MISPLALGLGASAGESPEAQARQAVFALAGDEEAGEEVDVFEHHVVAMGNALGPVSRPAASTGAVTRRKLRPRSLVRMNQRPLRWSMEYSCSSWRGQMILNCACRLVCGGQHLAFSRGVAGGFQDDEFAVAGAAGAEVEALVVVLVDQHVAGSGRAACVTPELVLALLLLVFDGSRRACVVGGPDDGAYALDFSGESLAGFEILDVEGVLAEAGGVSGVGEPAAVVGDVGGADGEEGMALGKVIAVEDDVRDVEAQASIGRRAGR